MAFIQARGRGRDRGSGGGRLVEPLQTPGYGNDTCLTIPGVAHVLSLNRQAATVNVVLQNDAIGTTDI